MRGWSHFVMGNFLTHDSLPGLFANLAFNEAEDAVVHVHGATTRETEPFPFLQGEFHS